MKALFVFILIAAGAFIQSCLPEKFQADSLLIASFIDGATDSSGDFFGADQLDAFWVVGLIYRNLGARYISETVINVCMLFLFWIFVLNRCNFRPISIKGAFVALVVVYCSIICSIYTKDIFSMILIGAFVFGRSSFVKFISLVGILFFSLFVRKQMVVVFLFSILLYFILHRLNSIWKFLFAMATVFLVMIAVVSSQVDGGLSDIRFSMNSVDAATYVQTKIDNVSVDPGWVSDVLNSFHSLLLIAVPFFFFSFNELWYAPVFLFFTMVLSYFLIATNKVVSTRGCRDSEKICGLAIVWSYFLTLQLYVPDYGAYARYMVVILPMVALDFALNQTSLIAWNESEMSGMSREK